MNQYINMGIVEFDAAIRAGTLSATVVLSVLDARIAKREASGQKQIQRVVEYRNQLAKDLNAAPVAVPTYTKAAPVSGPAPTDVDALLQHVKASVPAAELPMFIARLATI